MLGKRRILGLAKANERLMPGFPFGVAKRISAYAARLSGSRMSLAADAAADKPPRLPAFGNRVEVWSYEPTGDPEIDATRRDVMEARRRIAEARLLADSLRERRERVVGELRRRHPGFPIDELVNGKAHFQGGVVERTVKEIDRWMESSIESGEYRSTRPLGRNMGRNV